MSASVVKSVKVENVSEVILAKLRRVASETGKTIQEVADNLLAKGALHLLPSTVCALFFAVGAMHLFG